ncbi:MAG TPA: hypothetical protein VH496_07205 [Mycobacterium sp.]|jgi:peptidoglycan/LPS O-acetylase OafA/YrhL
MQVSATTVVLGAAALGAILAFVISRVRPRDGTAHENASGRSHILSVVAMLLLAVCAFVDAAVGPADRYLLVGIGIVLVVTSVVVLVNHRKRTTRV